MPTEERDKAQIHPALRKCISDLVGGLKPWPLYVYGPPGTGKTCAALAALDEFGRVTPNWRTAAVVQDWYAGFLRARNLTALIDADRGKFQWYRDGDTGRVQAESLLNVVDKSALFVIDDFGASDASEWAVKTMLDLLDRRCGSPPKPLIVTANIEPGDIGRYWDARIADRVLRGTVLKLEGTSKRTGF